MRKDDTALRPTSLDGYIGQEHIKEPLKAALTSAVIRDQPLPHVLLAGPPGLGKTTLAIIIANTLEWNFAEMLGSTAGRPADLTHKFLYLKEPTVFFMDEIHALRIPTQEVLYPILEDGKIYYPGAYGGVNSIPVVPLTVIGATTHMGKLAQPFVDRFQLQFALEFYDTAQLVELAKINIKKLELDIDEQSLMAVANRSRGTPRYLNNYLKWLRDYSIYHQEVGPLTAEYTELILSTKLKIDSKGLTTLDRQFLRALATQDGPVGLEAISSRLRQQEVTLENNVEPYLLYLGLVERIRNGRQITDLGREHLASLRRKK